MEISDCRSACSYKKYGKNRKRVSEDILKKTIIFS
jgi:hypothetical protein